MFAPSPHSNTPIDARRTITLESHRGSSFRALVLALFPLIAGGCGRLPYQTAERMERERIEILSERREILAQIRSMESRILCLEERVQELEDKTVVSCYRLLAKDHPAIETAIGPDCRSMSQKYLGDAEPLPYSLTTEATFDP